MLLNLSKIHEKNSYLIFQFHKILSKKSGEYSPNKCHFFRIRLRYERIINMIHPIDTLN